MSGGHCPGQDLSSWKPQDIAFVACPGCGAEIEIWKDEPTRTCQTCGKAIDNPAFDRGCEEWCGHAAECRP